MKKNSIIYALDYEHHKTDNIFFQIFRLHEDDETPLYPWLTQTSSRILDAMLMSQYGKRDTTNYLELLLRMDDKDQLEFNGDEEDLAIHLDFKLSELWQRVYQTLNVEYDPLTNYKKVEQRTPNLTFQKDSSVNVEIKNNTYGFNDEESVPSSDTSQDKTNNTESETKQHTGNETTTTTATQDMGANPSAFQDLLKQEIDTRTMYKFYDLIVKSVADEISIGVI